MMNSAPRRAVVFVCTVVVLLLADTTTNSLLASASSPCAEYAAPVKAFKFNPKSIVTEESGIVSSRLSPGVLWTHNGE